MKLNDFLLESGNNTISTRRIELLTLVESLADDMKGIATDTVTKPFNQFKKEQLTDFSKKLKVWAFSTLTEFGKDTTFYNTQKHYIETLKKIINNPQESAEQIFNAIINKQLNKDKESKLSSVLYDVAL